MNFVTKTDHVLERLSKSRRVGMITFVLAFLEQSISPILPEAYIVLILSYRKDISWKFLSFVSACGSTLGALITYGLGYFLYASYGATLIEKLGWKEVFEQAKTLFDNSIFVTQFLASLTPLPDRVFSFVAGAFGATLLYVLLGSFFGRLLRVGIIAYLAYEWGDEAREFIKKHTKIATLLLIIAIIAYGVYKM